MDALARSLSSVVVGRPRSVILVFVLLALLCAALATRVRVDTSVENLMIVDDPARDRNRQAREDFSNDELIVVAIDLGRPFGAPDLRRLFALSQEISALEDVEEVLDLSTISDVRGVGDTLDASPLVDLARVEEEIEAIRARTRGHRLYQANLVSERLDVVAMVVVLSPLVRSEASHRVSAQIAEIVARGAPEWTAYQAGFPTAESECNRIVRRETAVLSGVALVVVFAMIYVVARRSSALVLLAALLAWSEVVTLAWLGASGTPLSMVTSTLPTIVMATSTTYVIYLLGLFEHAQKRSEPVGELIGLLVRPVLLSGMSTAIGFLTLRLMKVEVIGHLGTALAVSSLAAVTGTLLLLPACIQAFGLRPSAAPAPEAGRWALLGVRLARRPGRVLGVASLLLLLLAPGLGRLRVDTDILDFFEDENPMRRGAKFVETRIAAAFVMNVVLETERENGALEPAVLEFAQRITDVLEPYPQVDRVVSFLDYLYLMDAALRPDEPPRTVLPSRALAAQYVLLYEAGGDPADFRHFLDSDRSALNLVVRYSSGSDGAIELYETVEALGRESPPHVGVDVLGSALLFHKAMNQISRAMTLGLFSGVGLIVAVMALMLGSFRLAVVAALPNLIPIYALLALLGWAGVPLSIGTSIACCAALGLAVDDTAHVLGHVQAEKSLETTYRLVARPLTLTTLVLGLGFGMLLASSFLPVSLIGVATASTMVIALVCDLLLLPSLLVLARGSVPPVQAHGSQIDLASDSYHRDRSVDRVAED